MSDTITLLLGPIFFVLGLALFIRTKWIKAKYRKTKGVVINHIEEWEGGKKWYYPVFEFTDHENNSITVTSENGSTPKIHNEGVPITVYYHPDNPEKAEINSVVMFYLFPILFMIAGLVVGLIMILPKILGK